jgi:hypothetical protein
MTRCTPNLIYVEHITWCAFEKAMNGKQCSERIMAILNMLWCHLALLMHLLFSNYIWWMMSFMSIQGWFRGLLYWWHPHFFEEHGGPWAPCMFGFGEASGVWTLRQIGEVWIPSIWSGIIGLRHLWRWHIFTWILVHMNTCKIQTIINWVIPTSIHDVQCFFGFADFYWCFIAHYYSIVASLI